MKEPDYKELKRGGMMRQREAGLFSVRLHLAAGRLDTTGARTVAEAAERFGNGSLHLTSRQGIEIPGVPAAALADLKEFLASRGMGVGVCGPTVRTVTACQGCALCPSGVIDSPALAQAVDRAFYGAPVPHKFKVGISGCANNCLKAEENDLGLKGWIEPRWTGEGCTGCGICAEVCPVKAVELSGDGGPVSVDLERCIGCGDCIRSCPGGAMREGARGFRVLAGGKLGRVPSLGRRVLGVLSGEAAALAVVRGAIEFFRRHGRAGERFGDTLQRVGFKDLEEHLTGMVEGRP